MRLRLSPLIFLVLGSLTLSVDPAAPWSTFGEVVDVTNNGYVLRVVASVNSVFARMKPTVLAAPTRVTLRFRARCSSGSASRGIIGLMGHTGTGYTWTGIGGGAIKIISGKAYVLGSTVNPCEFLVGGLSDIEDSVVELSADVVSNGFAFESSSIPDYSGTAKVGNAAIIGSFVATDPTGKVLFEANGAPRFQTGDRLENTAWDGSQTTPIAWVCVATGNPGVWHAVYNSVFI